MSNHLTVVGNVTDTPNLRFAPSGSAWVTFTVADNRKGSDGVEAASFIVCKAFKEMAENIASSVDKGCRVVAQGRLEQESWEKDGQKRSRLVLIVDAIGPDLRFATARVARNTTVMSGSGKVQTVRGQGDPWASAPEPVEPGPEPEPW